MCETYIWMHENYESNQPYNMNDMQFSDLFATSRKQKEFFVLFKANQWLDIVQTIVLPCKKSIVD